MAQMIMGVPELGGQILHELWKTDRNEDLYKMFVEAFEIDRRNYPSMYNDGKSKYFYNTVALMKIIRATVRMGARLIVRDHQPECDIKDMLLFLWQCCEIHYRVLHSIDSSTTLNDADSTIVQKIFTEQYDRLHEDKGICVDLAALFHVE